jgi:hypothetical protein
MIESPVHLQEAQLTFAFGELPARSAHPPGPGAEP